MQLAAMAFYDAAADIQAECAHFTGSREISLGVCARRGFALQRGAVSDLDEHPLRQHIGAHRDSLVRRIFQRLLGMYEQVKKYLLQLALRAQHIQRSVLDQVTQLNAASLPLAIAKLDQVPQQPV